MTAAKLAKTGKKIADGIDTANDVKKGVEATTDASKALPTNTPKPKTETPAKPTKCNSFVPGTRVLLADGSTKAIEDVKVGDRVLASDVESGDRQSRPVTQLIRGDGVKKLVTIVVDTDGTSGDKTGTIVATDGHKFYLPDSGVWVTAGQLKAGAWLQTSSGTWVQISAIRHKTQVQRVHNFTVDGQHTYYVLVGETPVLAHNDACPNKAAQEDLANLRQQTGMKSVAQEDADYAAALAAGVSKSKLPKKNTLARLDYGGQSFYGQNGRNIGRPVGFPGKGNRMTATSFEDHAEGDVFSQALAGTTRGGSANLFVDRAPCRFCRNSMAGYADQLGLDSLHVYGPQGLHGVYQRSVGRYVPV